MTGAGTTQIVARPLEGVHVLDLTQGPAACVTRHLAELGADVVRVETAHNRGDRMAGPSACGIGLAFAAANIGKQGLPLDLNDPDLRARLGALVEAADILVESTVPGSPEARQLDIEVLRGRNPALVVLSISDFGPGRFQHWQATDAVLCALNGELSRSGIPGRPPLMLPGELAIQCALAQAVYALLVAYVHRLQTGLGDHLDLSLLDGSTIALDPGFGVGGSATAGKPASDADRGRPHAAHLYPVLPCKDGFARLCILARRQWQGMFEWMGRPPEFADPAFDDLRHRFASTRLQEAIAAFIATKTRAEIEAESLRFRVPAAAVQTLDEVLRTAHIAERRVFREVSVASGLALPLPDGMMTIDGVRAGAPAILPGQDLSAADLLERWSTTRLQPRIAGFGKPGLPFGGLRVLDMGVIVVGAEQGRLLADYGADVIKIESPAFPDGSRASSEGGMSPGFAAGHRNKRSLAIDLRSDAGLALFLSLVERADVLLSNFKPGTLQSLGLSEDILFARNPGLVTVESSAFGDTGSWSGRMGYGPLVRASAGLSAQWRYPDDPGSYADTATIYPDHVAARVAISGVIALLVRRAASGIGGRITISQLEVMLAQMAPDIAGQVLVQRGVALDGLSERDVPWGVFPCAGDDEWCVITVRSDTDWQALCQVSGRVDLAADPALAHAGGRIASRERIEAAVAEWTCQHSPLAVMALLQEAGVPAGAMLRVAELPGSDYFVDRPLFRQFVQPGLPDPVRVDALPVRSARLAEPTLRPAPRMGEHSRDVLGELAGIGSAEISSLIERGVITE